MRFSVEKELLKEAIAGIDYKISNEKYVGCGHFIVLREHAGELSELIEKAEREEKEVKSEKIDLAIPNEIGSKFEPIQHYTGTGCQSFVSDGKKPFNAKYYWLLVEKMGFSIHGDDPQGPHALVKNGEIVGACMFMSAYVLDFLQEAA